ncbi:MAG: IMPACT family protein [Actinomycetaceae bacterium]|nr:IMPACT family protein [Arcanobacterium sp.]MDD7687566.1 IMPACT family protein [Actinomycetaceae bacterium]MDY5273040.1 YigZ family protein [Arcanobacterium sp.]
MSTAPPPQAEQTPDATEFLRLPLATTLRGELTIKRSRFIASATRVSSLAAAREFFAAIRTEFPDARHHCTALSVMEESISTPIVRSSDDGEPAGTAGRPMLGVLHASRLTDVAVVVTRYFGGTLLGTGGLVRAYSDSVRGVLDGAPVLRRKPARTLRLSAPYAIAGKLEADLRTHGFDHIESSYTPSSATLSIRVSESELNVFHSLVAQLTNGALKPHDDGSTYIEIRAGKLALIASGG